MKMVMSCAVAVFFAITSPLNAIIQDQREDEPQTPDMLCHCGGNDSSKGGIRTFEEYAAKYGSTYKDRDELELAWKVYKAVNQCDAVVVIGRLPDTKGFRDQPGYCVLRKLEGWTMRVNQAFIRGATDRGAKIQLVSDAPLEAMSPDADINNIRSEDREARWIVIYNNEIQWILGTGRYTLKHDPSKSMSPITPAYLEANASKAPAAAGNLQLVDMKPDPDCKTWDFYTACDGKAGRIAGKTGWGSVTYQWTPPPKEIGPEGITINLQAAEQTPPNAPVATGLNINGGGLEIDPPGATLSIGKEGASRSLSVRLKPPKNAAGDYYLKIGVYWGPGFTYHYRASP